MISDISRLIEQVSREKGIEKKIVTEAIIQGLLSAARKKHGTYRDIEAKYNEETGDLELYEFKIVVPDDEFEDEQIEIKLSEALKLDPEATKNDQIGLKLDVDELGRIDAQTARNIIYQNLKTAEHEMIFNEFEKKRGEVVNGIVRRVERGAIVVDLEKTEAYIPRREQIPGEKYKPGDRIQGYILEVEQKTRGPQIIMSRAHPEYLIKLFEMEVPEIYEGIVKIKKAAREPGQRAKIAVYSLDSAVHPVGACVGMKGVRIQSITQELKGERIDVVVWEDDPVQFVCNSLAPAKLSKIYMDEENKRMDIIVAEDQLSLAIGKKGQNVRLAVQLSEWKLDILSEQDYENKRRDSIFNLCLLPSVDETQAQSIFQTGINHVKEVMDLSLKKAQSIPGYESQEKATALIQEAKKLVLEYESQGKEFEVPPSQEDEKKEQKKMDAQAQADLRLKREMERLQTQNKPEDSSLDSSEQEQASPTTEEAEEKQASPTTDQKTEAETVETKQETAQQESPSEEQTKVEEPKKEDQ